MGVPLLALELQVAQGVQGVLEVQAVLVHPERLGEVEAYLEDPGVWVHLEQVVGLEHREQEVGQVRQGQGVGQGHRERVVGQERQGQEVEQGHLVQGVVLVLLVRVAAQGLLVLLVQVAQLLWVLQALLRVSSPIRSI